MSKKVTKKNNKFTPQFRRKVVLEIEDGNKKEDRRGGQPGHSI